MEAVFQFFVLFSGPLGILGLLAVVVVLWSVRSWRRDRPRLRVVSGGAERQARASASPGPQPDQVPQLGPGPEPGRGPTPGGS